MLSFSFSRGVLRCVAALVWWPCLGAQAQAPVLPASVQAALAQAKVPPQALSVVVREVQAAPQGARLSWRAQEPMNPASVMKLVTTFAALDLLGPAYVWETPVYLQGVVHEGRLQGNVYIQGRGDPQLVVERLWLLLRQLQAQGVRHIEGDIVLDRSAFEVGAHDPSAFDGEPQRAYNVAPDALLINYQALVMRFVPDSGAGVAHVRYEPPLAGMSLPSTVPLAPAGSACADWRTALQAELGQPQAIRFAGQYSASCGSKEWAVATAQPDAFAARAVQGLWREMGGGLSGVVRTGHVPAGLSAAFVYPSRALAEVVRDINKYSNNVMTQQVLLTLGREQGTGGHFDAARQVLARWWRARLAGLPEPVVDNGAGLSREARISAEALARLLQVAWAAPVMPELLASLPIAGVDGTLRRSQSRAVGQAHLKTGSLRDVLAIAGYVHAADGRRYVLVVLVNHANAAAARPVLDALLDWTLAGR